MTDTPEILLEDMRPFSEPRTCADPVAELEAEFGPRARALGARAVFTHLFRTHQDASLSVWLNLLTWLWKDVSYPTWLEILQGVADERRFVHQFLWFASESLALDVHRLPVLAVNVRTELDGETFRDGGPLPISARLRARLEDDFDYERVWQRLEREGAPMRHVPPDATDRHMLEL